MIATSIHSKYRIRLTDLFRICRVDFRRNTRGDDRWQIAKAFLLAHTFRTTSRNPYVAVRPLSTERFRRRSRAFSKKRCMVAVSRRAVLIAATKNRSPAAVGLIRCLAGELMTRLTSPVAVAPVTNVRQEILS